MTPADIFALASLAVSVLTLVVIVLDFFGFREKVKDHQKLGVFAALLMVWAVYYLVTTNVHFEQLANRISPDPTPTTSATPYMPSSSSPVATSTPIMTPVPTPVMTSTPIVLSTPIASSQPNTGNQPFTSPAITPSFPCWKAKTAVEITICHTPELAAEEQQMSEAYGAVLHELYGTDQRTFRRQHYEWFKQYSAECNNAAASENTLQECIKRYLSSHTEELHQRLSHLK